MQLNNPKLIFVCCVFFFFFGGVVFSPTIDHHSFFSPPFMKKKRKKKENKKKTYLQLLCQFGHCFLQPHKVHPDVIFLLIITHCRRRFLRTNHSNRESIIEPRGFQIWSHFVLFFNFFFFHSFSFLQNFQKSIILFCVLSKETNREDGERREINK